MSSIHLPRGSALACLAAGLLLWGSPAPALAAPNKEQLCGTYRLEGTDTIGHYQGTLRVTWEWPSIPVGLEAELEYDDGTTRTWRTGGYYSSSRKQIRFSYKLREPGIVAHLPGAGDAEKVKVRGELQLNDDATRLQGTVSGAGFSDRILATRDRPGIKMVRLAGTYVIRASWAKMSEWRLQWRLGGYQGAEVEAPPSDLPWGRATRCEQLDLDTMCCTVWSSTSTREEIILRIVADSEGKPCYLVPVRCYTIHVDTTSADPATRLEVLTDVTITQPDGRVLD